MKRSTFLTVLVVAIILALIGGIVYDRYASPEEASAPTVSQTNHTDQEVSSQGDRPSDAGQPIFNETVTQGDNPWPQASIPDDLSTAELQAEITKFYETNYSDADRSKNQQPVADSDLAALQSVYDGNETFQGLQAQVDQVQLEIGGDDLYVVRVVVPMTYDQAEAIKEKQDITLLNEALSQVDNHLVLLAYYDEAADQLIPYHLTNNTDPLFTYLD